MPPLTSAKSFRPTEGLKLSKVNMPLTSINRIDLLGVITRDAMTRKRYAVCNDATKRSRRPKARLLISSVLLLSEHLLWFYENKKSLKGGLQVEKDCKKVAKEKATKEAKITEKLKK
ncbi:hypothetical protein COCNU_04G003530 [Cocos nucifera]|uniref:Uncharacterized protein n=1 Tax=Cocos nucifera TaxID=13894 RepID=A0A8K0MZX6_COCNU|nr:hypothetical protein COCNU_04G003530 [Cocos nucifera]